MGRPNTKKCPECGRVAIPAFKRAKARAKGHLILILLTAWRCDGCGWKQTEPYEDKVQRLGLQLA